MNLPMEMMNPILFDDGVASEAMEANRPTRRSWSRWARIRSAAFTSARRVSLGAYHGVTAKSQHFLCAQRAVS
jgi:hypothetical protein